MQVLNLLPQHLIHPRIACKDLCEWGLRIVSLSSKEWHKHFGKKEACSFYTTGVKLIGLERHSEQWVNHDSSTKKVVSFLQKGK
jgi:hypothetical protein